MKPENRTPNTERRKTETPPKKRSRAWIWFFIILAVLCAAAVTTMIVFNLSQQLTVAELEAAEALWRKNGPKNYEMEYVKIIGRAKHSEIIFVRVENGKVTFATLNDAVIRGGKGKYYDVNGMFSDLKRFLEKDTNMGIRAYLTAVFDEHDGHPRKYIRNVNWGGERVEIRERKFRKLP